MGAIQRVRDRRSATLSFRFVALSVFVISFTLSGCDDPPFSSQSVGLPSSTAISINDPFLSDGAQRWHLEVIRAPFAWGIVETMSTLSYAGEDIQSVVISVIDNGIVAGHEDLSSTLTSDGVYLTGGTYLPLPNGVPSSLQNSGHGTHVAGLIGAVGNNGVGVCGGAYNGWPAPLVRLQPIVVLDGNRSGSVADVIAGILYAAGSESSLGGGAQSPSEVINMSLGAESLSKEEILLFENAITVAAARDVVMVAASGNGTGSPVRKGVADGIDIPASLSEVIAVGAVQSDLTRAYFSDYGPELELVAPGATSSGPKAADNVGILSTYAPSGYALLPGTSMATPLVAAAVGLIRSANPFLSRDQVRTILHETARDLGPEGRDDEYGYGLVDMEKALQRALQAPYGRFAATQHDPRETVPVHRQLSEERRLAYEESRAIAEWNPDRSRVVLVLVEHGTDLDAAFAELEIGLIGRSTLPEGVLFRVTIDGNEAPVVFETLKGVEGVLLVSQDRMIEF